MNERYCTLVGMKFRPPALGLLAALPSGFPLVLSREPGNVHDSNAIQVLVTSRDELLSLDEQMVNEKLAGFGFERDDIVARLPFHLAYVPREDASEISPIVDAASITSWRGVLTFSPTGLARVTFVLP